MIAHTTLPVSNYKKAKLFYMQTLSPLGYKKNMEGNEAAGFNDGKNTDFWIEQVNPTIPTHLAFEAKSRQEVDDFYKAALAAGAADNGKPGYRVIGQATMLHLCMTLTGTILKLFGTTMGH
ncbi:VOC family protein [Acidihalobacter prosperus]